MKTALVLALVIAPVALPAQPAANPDPDGFSVIQRALHSRVWERLDDEPVASGQGAIVHRVTEIGTGLCFADDEQGGALADSNPDFVITPEGHALATRCQHKLIVSPNAEIDLQAPDGARFRSRLAGLALVDRLTGKALQVGQFKESEGQLVAPNCIVFPGAIEGLAASLRLRNEIGGFHHEVLLEEKLSARQLARMGFPNPANVSIQVWTAFTECPEPVVRPLAPKAVAAPGTVPPDPDSTVEFAAMRLAPGIAFSEPQPGLTVPVHKLWVEDGGTKYLVESCDYQALAPLLAELHESRLADAAKPSTDKLLANANAPVLPTLNGYPIRPKDRVGFSLSHRERAGVRGIPAPDSASPPQPRRIARLASSPSRSTPVVALDYVFINATFQSLRCQGDTTYYLTAPAYINQLVLEGSSVIKVTNSPNATIVATNIVCENSMYRPVVITCKDQNGVGENVPGSTGSPSGHYGGIALDLQAASTPVLSNIRFSYLNNALAGTGITLRNCQILRCMNAFAEGPAHARLYNVLAHRLNRFVNMDGDAGDSLIAQNVTAHYITNFHGDVTSSFAFTNCLFVCVTNWHSMITETNSSVFLNSDAGVFQTVGAGEHYLPEDSPYRGSGVATTNIDLQLLADLKKRTTAPPIVYSNATISVDTTFYPQAQRDTLIECLGYHIDPLDYAFGNVTANANLTFAPGTAAGWFRTTSGWYHAGHGIHMGNTNLAAFNGTAETPCYWVRCSTVQEGLNGFWQGGYGPGGITGWAPSTATAPTVQARFLLASQLANDALHFRDDYGWLIVRAAHSEFYAGGLGGYGSSEYLTNCLFHRNSLWLAAGQTDIAWHLRNCTFIGGSFAVNRYANPCYVGVRDTAFDATSIPPSDVYTNNPTYTYYDYNAFLTNASRTVPHGTYDLLVTNFNWRTNWLGNYYVPTNSPLINTGSVTANLVGLYHFCTTTNQQKELSTQVDRGYHYVAVAVTNGVPYDYDGDGTPDYLEDLNGNGVGTDDPTSWTTFNSSNGLSPGNGLKVFTPLR